MRPSCTETLVIRDDEWAEGFRIECPSCGYVHFDGGSLDVFEYDVRHVESNEVLASGTFSPRHDEYIAAAERVKYCLNCYTLQPLTAFDRHSARASGRQGECRICKEIYNELKNPTRLIEQHREAADNRRLLREVSGETTVSGVEELLERFDHQCFNCGKALERDPIGEDGFYLDHTLPVFWLWPLDHGPTILCRVCNAQKADRWPSDFYGEPRKLRALATKTGIPYEVLAGNPAFNEEAISRLEASPDAFIERWVAYPERLRALRDRILVATGRDVFTRASPAARSSIRLDPVAE